MKKLKKMWENNRVLIVLAITVVLCFWIMGVVMIRYFFGGNTSSYGDRLDDINSLPFKEEDQETLKNKIQENEGVEKATVKVKGKIIYIRIQVKETTSLDGAKSIANKSLEHIAKEYQEKYDLEYTLVQEATEKTKGFTIMGAKNINRPTLVWNNNTPVKDKE